MLYARSSLNNSPRDDLFSRLLPAENPAIFRDVDNFRISAVQHRMRSVNVSAALFKLLNLHGRFAGRPGVSIPLSAATRREVGQFVFKA